MFDVDGWKRSKFCLKKTDSCVAAKAGIGPNGVRENGLVSFPQIARRIVGNDSGKKVNHRFGKARSEFFLFGPVEIE